MLPKVRASLLKNLKALPTENEKVEPPEYPPEHKSAQVIPFPKPEGEDNRLENNQEPSQQQSHEIAQRNPIIEFFGKIRLGFPTLRAIVVNAYSIAAKGLKSGSRQKKGILVDHDQL